MITVKNLHKYFGDKHILKDVSCLFEAGKTNLIIGASGSGKTTLIKCMIGLLNQDKGQIFFDKQDFNSIPKKEKRLLRQEMGMLFQGGALFDHLTVKENIEFSLTMFSSMSEEEKAQRVEFCLNRVNLPNSQKLLPSELSGGMVKRVAIARAIAMNPKYLFCDEPNSGLDPQTSIIIDNLIYEITQEFNITTVVNTHDMNSVIEIGDNISFVHEGSIEWSGTKESIMNSDSKKLNDFVFASQLFQKLKRAKT
jgi:phospholipid/cholesterol/gamma-HCH transport system ATP-binding protein